MVQQIKRQFVTTAEGKKTAILLPLQEYYELLEDLEDLAIIAERRDEPAVPFDVVKKKLEQKWQRTKSK